MLAEAAFGGIPILAVMAEYGQIGLLVCVIAQIISMVAGRVLNKLTFQREAVSLTCAFASFSAGTYVTHAHTVWLVLFIFAFSLVYFYMPKLAGANDY